MLEPSAPWGWIEGLRSVSPPLSGAVVPCRRERLTAHEVSEGAKVEVEVSFALLWIEAEFSGSVEKGHRYKPSRICEAVLTP